MLIATNNLQTPVTEKLLDRLDSRSRIDFMDSLERITFIQRLISDSRGCARDRKKDSKGRIIVDLENLHILEDMDYFRERAIYYQKHGVYTHLYPNSAPNSEYRKFWDEERRRCKEGYVRESDGEWIPGYYYYYLNYSPIDIVVEDDVIDTHLDDLEANVRASRVEDFPHIWDGDYLFFHYIERAEARGKHGTVLKCRGRGYSFKAAAMLARNYFLIKKSKSFAFASEQEYLLKDGLLTKTWANLNYIDNHTPWSQPRDYADREIHKRASYRDLESKTEKGFMSEIIGVTCKNDPQKGRGKRGKLLVFEESGTFPGLKQTFNIARKSMEQGRSTFGLELTMGTGGTVGADFEAAEEFFYHPNGYNILSLKNIFDKDAPNSECGLFIPEYLNRQGCYDNNGNSDVIKALIEIFIARQLVRNNSSDPNSLVQEKAESPITPQESVLRVEGNKFPVMDLKELLAGISANVDGFVKGHYTGNFTIGSQGKVDFRFNTDARPIREFPLKDIYKEGAVEIFEMPKPVSDSFRYIIGVDTYDDDDVKYSTSLGSIIAFDRWTRRIVAEYTGRPQTAAEFYEIVYRMSRFYNAMVMYENNKKGLFAYFQLVKKDISILADTPEYLSDRSSLKPSYGNTAKGINATERINTMGRNLQVTWMLQNAYTDTPIEEGEVSKLNLHTIRSIGYIKECIAWNPDINADRVSAMNMVMLFDAELSQYEDGVTREKAQTRADDPFFKKVYRSSRPDTETGLLERITPMTSFGYKGMQKSLIGN